MNALTDLTFGSESEHRAWVAKQAQLPRGFRASSVKTTFQIRETGKQSPITLTLIAADKPTPDFALMFTQNAFPGAPVIVGRELLNAPKLGAVVINNKVSNVAAPSGVEASRMLCDAAAQALGFEASAVLPASTGVIGWRLPVDELADMLPKAKTALSNAPDAGLVAAAGIMTTDLFPKARRAQLGDGCIMGIAKGAGMIEPNLATMLVFILTDVAIPRELMRSVLPRVVARSFNAISIDSDQSTSDTVAMLSSGVVACPSAAAFESALEEVCVNLARDIVRNGEGVHHVMRVDVQQAASVEEARRVGKSVVNSPLVQCAICGNDPNVGRILMAVGKAVQPQSIQADKLRIELGGHIILDRGIFTLTPVIERELSKVLKSAELYDSVAPADGVTFRPLARYPIHERDVAIRIQLGTGQQSATVWGADRSHEYISENADYRS